MRFAYIDSQGNEVTIPSVDALRLRIELQAIVDDTMFHDANSGKWAPAREHEIFRTLQRELEELDAGGFDPSPVDEGVTPPPPAGPAEPAGASGTGLPEGGPETGIPAGDRAPGGDAGPEETAPGDDAGSGLDDDFGLGMTLDLAPEETEDDAVSARGSDPEEATALEGLDDLQLVEDEGPEDVPSAEPPGGAAPSGTAPAGPGEGTAPETGEEPSWELGEEWGGDDDGDDERAAPERFAMSPQDDLMDSVPDPGTGTDAGAGDLTDDATGALGGLELEPTLADGYDTDSGDLPPERPSLELEQPLSDYDADQPPAWMNESDDAEAELLGGAPPPPDDRDVPPVLDRGEPPARPAPRPRNAPPPRKLTRARTPGAGRLVGLVLLVAVLGVAGFYGAQYVLPLLGGDEGDAAAVALPPLPDELMPQMRAFAADATEEMVETVGALPERDAIPPRPDPEWLAGTYLAGASSFESVPAYWQSILDYLDAVEATADPAFREALDEEIADATLTADNAALIRTRAVAGWEAAARDRQLVFDQLRAVGSSALTLHDFLVANEAQIQYEPTAAGVSRDPVLEAVPATDAIADGMRERVAAVTGALDNLGFLETVTTEGLLETFLEKLDATPIR